MLIYTLTEGKLDFDTRIWSNKNFNAVWSLLSVLKKKKNTHVGFTKLRATKLVFNVYCQDTAPFRKKVTHILSFVAKHRWNGLQSQENQKQRTRQNKSNSFLFKKTTGEMISFRVFLKTILIWGLISLEHAETMLHPQREVLSVQWADRIIQIWLSLSSGHSKVLRVWRGICLQSRGLNDHWADGQRTSPWPERQRCTWKVQSNGKLFSLKPISKNTDHVIKNSFSLEFCVRGNFQNVSKRSRGFLTGVAGPRLSRLNRTQDARFIKQTRLESDTEERETTLGCFVDRGNQSAMGWKQKRIKLSQN